MNVPSHSVAPNPPVDYSFYQDASHSDAIMKVEHFTHDILFQLQAEAAFLGGVIAHAPPRRLIEVGSHMGAGLLLAKVFSLGYVGIDMNARALGVLNQRAAREDISDRCRIIHGDATQESTWRMVGDLSDDLVFLPFNLLGTVGSDRSLLGNLSAARPRGVVLSVFGDKAVATSVRVEYYEKCRIEDLEVRGNEFGGKTFYGAQRFVSHSYSLSGLTKLLREHGFAVIERSETALGYFLHVV